ncbi:uncharacterized protein LOC120864744 [Oryx dammah]|uniref:uncharacterized protein LOC120864744 n=1 Tax=Oryx dammah TaxID=59534 RepID=UPI001A9ABB9F|nr:uncharacterized protein LOC120864744 [Oryx dammah]XP_040097757.1 uncharacterized protein LOC120864744 [Oryx dammah]
MKSLVPHGQDPTVSLAGAPSSAEGPVRMSGLGSAGPLGSASETRPSSLSASHGDPSVTCSRPQRPAPACSGQKPTKRSQVLGPPAAARPRRALKRKADEGSSARGPRRRGPRSRARARCAAATSALGWLIGVSGGRGSSRSAAGTAVRSPEAWGPRLWLPARAPRSPRTRARLSAVFAFAFLPRALRKMKVAVSRACAAAVGARGAPCGAASLERASRSLSPHPARWR